MGKDAKGKSKGKTHAKRVKGGKCSAEEQDVKESTDKPRAFVAFGKVFFLCLTNDQSYFLKFLLWAGCFRFLYPRTCFALDFSTGIIVKSFHVEIFVKCIM